MHRAIPALFATALFSCRQAPPAERAPAAQAAPEPAPAPRPSTGPAHVTLLFSASVAGELVPCGCSPDQRGGAPRMAALLDSLRKQEPDLVYVDAGDLLFESPARPNAQLVTQKELKARALATAAADMKAAARAVGPRDLALGPQLVVDTAQGVPLLDAGAARIDAARPTALVDAGSVRVGLLAAGLGQEPLAGVASRVQQLRQQGARLVALLLLPAGDGTWGTAEALLPAAQQAGVDLVVLGRRDDPSTDGNRKAPGPPPLLAVEGNGQSLLRVDVRLGEGPLQLARGAEDRDAELKALDVRIERFRAQAKLNPDRAPQLDAKVRELTERRAAVKAAPLPEPPAGAAVATATFVPLTQQVGSDARVQALVDAYDRKVAQLNLAEAKRQPEACPRARQGDAHFVGVGGEQGCASCHEDAAAFWRKTRHAHAYDTLVKVDKQFSLDCIRCHVTGWQQPGGVCRIDLTERGGPGFQGAGVGRRDVQCEDCHGPGSNHAAEPAADNIRRAVPVSTCVRCHEAANSPRFDDAKYRPFILGPGHGQPLAPGQTPQPKPGSPLAEAR